MFPAVSTRQECVIPGAPSWQQPHQRNGDGPISENQARSSRDEPRLEATYRKALARRAGGGWLVAGLCGADAGGTSGHVRRGRPNNPNSRGCTRVLLYSSQHATDLLRRSVHHGGKSRRLDNNVSFSLADGCCQHHAGHGAQPLVFEPPRAGNRRLFTRRRWLVW